MSGNITAEEVSARMNAHLIKAGVLTEKTGLIDAAAAKFKGVTPYNFNPNKITDTLLAALENDPVLGTAEARGMTDKGSSLYAWQTFTIKSVAENVAKNGIPNAIQAVAKESPSAAQQPVTLTGLSSECSREAVNAVRGLMNKGADFNTLTQAGSHSADVGEKLARVGCPKTPTPANVWQAANLVKSGVTR